MSKTFDDSIHPGGAKQRRTRLRLNCSECRGKKLSCDRQLPCQRCVRSGRPELCSFDSFPAGTMPPNPAPFNHSTVNATPSRQTDDQIRELQAEIAQLREYLYSTKISQRPGSDGYEETLEDAVATTSDSESDGQRALTPPPPIFNVNLPLEANQRPARGPNHNSALLQLFHEMPQLSHIINQVSEGHFKLHGISINRLNYSTDDAVDVRQLVSLLPPKEDTDALVSFYLNHFEHVHRIVHITTFEQEYTNYWLQDPLLRYPAQTALVLSIISLAISSSTIFPDDSVYRIMVPKWIHACDKWIDQQRPKGRNLVYYQVSCLVYLAKRMNSVRRRPFWNETGSLIQEAIMDGLHRAPSATDSPYVAEMKRRIWAVMRELDLQNAFEYGLPTILHTLKSTTAAPANLDDSAFHKNSKTLPAPKAATEYTPTSYQSLSAHSWDLRLNISRRLFTASPQLSSPLSTEQVLQYTYQITQALDSLPAWTIESGASNNNECGLRKVALLSWVFLQFQLKECFFAIHRPYLHRNSDMYSFSEMICYHAAKEVLLFNRKLAVMGTQSLTLMRHDLPMACLILARVTLERPKGTISVPIVNVTSSISLLEDCIPFLEAAYLRCVLGEYKLGFLALSVLIAVKVHVGKMDLTEAMGCCSGRLLGLYRQHIARQFDQQAQMQGGGDATGFEASGEESYGGSTGWNFELGYNHSFDLEMDWDDSY